MIYAFGQEMCFCHNPSYYIAKEWISLLAYSYIGGTSSALTCESHPTLKIDVKTGMVTVSYLFHVNIFQQKSWLNLNMSERGPCSYFLPANWSLHSHFGSTAVIWKQFSRASKQNCFEQPCWGQQTSAIDILKQNKWSRKAAGDGRDAFGTRRRLSGGPSPEIISSTLFTGACQETRAMTKWVSYCHYECKFKQFL